MFDLTFTGPCKGFTRAQLTQMATAKGHKVRSSYCSKTTLVVADVETAIEGASTKARKASQEGTPMMSYQEFLRRVLGVPVQAEMAV